MSGALERAGADALDPLATDPVIRAARLFDACPNKAEIGTFIIAHAAEQRLRGFAYGALIGIGAAAAAYLYFLRRKAGG